MRIQKHVLPPTVLLLLVAWGLLTIRIGAPWFGHHDGNGLWISSAVRNYQLYGAANLGFMQVTNAGPVTPDSYVIYTHHPPLVVWLSALGSIPFGLTEASLRFVAASATLISVVAFFVLVRRLFGAAWAWKSAAFYILNPMMAYFGRMPNHEALALAIGMLFAATLVNWTRRPITRHYIVLMILTWVAAWTAWTAILYVGTLGIAALLLGNRVQRVRMIGLAVVGSLSLATLIVLYRTQKTDLFSDFLQVFLWRTSNQSFRSGSTRFTIGQFAGRMVIWQLAFATPALFLLGLAGVRRTMRYGSRIAVAVMLALFAMAISYLLVFRNAAFIHDYYGIFLLPPLSISAVAILTSGRKRRLLGPIFSGLLLASFVVGVANFVLLHRSGNGACCASFADALARNATADDLIMSNLPLFSAANEYYAFRTVEWNTPADVALARSRATRDKAIYVFCDGTDYTVSNGLLTISEAAISPQPPANAPDELAALPHIVDGGCFFYQLN